MKRMKLWAGIGIVVLAQTGVVTVDKSGLGVSAGPSPAYAQRGERGERGDRGERGQRGERGERGRGERGRGERGRGERGRGERGERGVIILPNPFR